MNTAADLPQFFLFKTNKDTDAQVLAAKVNAILVLSIRACTIRLRTIDLFDGNPVAAYMHAKVSTIRNSLTAEEAEEQEKTVTIWDEEGRQEHKKPVKQGSLGAGGVDSKRNYAQITECRLAIAHLACLKWKYGERGETDFVSKEQDGELLINEVIAANDTIEKKAHAPSKTAEANRATLRMETKTTWSESSRMKNFIKVCRQHQQQHAGPVLVFSKFLSALDVVENALRGSFDCTVRIARYDGTVPTAKRTKIVNDFQDGQYDYMLITSRCGGLGLTLTRANGVVHLTPLWNPHLEAQCSSRTVRIGQEQQVHIYHLYSPESIERRILLKQQNKKKKAVRILDPDQSMLDLMAEVAMWDEDKFAETVSALLDFCCSLC
jgi:SNF2 family DNA or RNA helicase